MPSPHPLSLDQFIALNEEMAALVRAGVPLDRGLADLGRDLPGRLGEMASSLGERIHRGEPLEKIVAEENSRFPPLFRAVIVAGARSGNLSAALEGLATTTRRVREMRRLVGVAIIYPLFVLIVAVVLFALLAQRLSPVLANLYREWSISQTGFVDAVAWLGERAWHWAPWIPLAVVVLGGVWWWRSSRAARVQVSGRAGAFAWFPTLARLSKAGRMASFAEVLRLLVAHRVPLPEALILAGQASGDRRLEHDARRMAERLQSGVAGGSQEVDSSFPPLLLWLLTGGAPEKQLLSALEHVGRAYRHEALRMAAWLSTYLPLVLTVAIGGTVVLAYSLTVLGPVFYLMKEMGRP